MVDVVLIAFTTIKYAKGTTEEDLAAIIGSDLIIKRAYEELDRYAWSPEKIRTYDSIDMKQSANKAILEGALKTAREDGIEKVARNMLTKGIDTEIITSVTGLTQQEIEAFLSHMDN